MPVKDSLLVRLGQLSLCTRAGVVQGIADLRVRKQETYYVSYVLCCSRNQMQKSHQTGQFDHCKVKGRLYSLTIVVKEFPPMDDESRWVSLESRYGMCAFSPDDSFAMTVPSAMRLVLIEFASFSAWPAIFKSPDFSFRANANIQKTRCSGMGDKERGGKYLSPQFSLAFPTQLAFNPRQIEVKKYNC